MGVFLGTIGVIYGLAFRKMRQDDLDRLNAEYAELCRKEPIR